MSLLITKGGFLDTIQDMGRTGLSHLGVNPGGAMDRFSARLANALLGKELGAPVIELHFPCSSFLFEEEAVICLAGACFTPMVNGTVLPLNRPVAIGKGQLLEFKGVNKGARSYMALLPSLQLTPWLGSFSTHLKAEAGGWMGRRLEKGDRLPFCRNERIPGVLNGAPVQLLPWRAEGMVAFGHSVIEILRGSEWNWLTAESKELLLTEPFVIAGTSDRMGYRLSGRNIYLKENVQLLSSGVSFGTVQLLPNHQLILLMADHQTTGGYPRIAQVVSADLPLLAQKTPKEKVQFKLVSLQEAEEKAVAQEQYLHLLQNNCTQKIKDLLHASL